METQQLVIGSHMDCRRHRCTVIEIARCGSQSGITKQSMQAKGVVFCCVLLVGQYQYLAKPPASRKVTFLGTGVSKLVSLSQRAIGCCACLEDISLMNANRDDIVIQGQQSPYGIKTLVEIS
jgi:hypothetical protein